MDDISKLKEDFLTEAREHLLNVEDDILEIENLGHNFQPDTINHLFRAIHSIKGSSSFLELTNITELSHALENVIDQIRDENLFPNENVTEALFKGIDKLKELLDDLDNQNENSIILEVESLNQLNTSPIIEQNKKEQIRKKNPSAAKISQQPAEKEQKIVRKKNQYIYQCSIDLISECDEKKRLPAELIKNITVLGKVIKADFSKDNTGSFSDKQDSRLIYSFTIQTIIEDKDLIIEGLDINPIHIEQLHAETEEVPAEKIKHSAMMEIHAQDESVDTPEKLQMEESDFEKDAVKPMKDKTIAERPGTEPERTGASAMEDGQSQDRKTASSTVRISVALLDKLMNLASELVLVRNQNMQSAETGDINQLRIISKKLNVVTSEIQASIMQTRMQSMDTVFSKFTRMVRDLSKKLNKNISIEIFGRDVELDKNIIEAIGDPMTHIIRNAVDHGIEKPAERERAGKPRTGKILIGAYHQAGHVNIRVQDDGKGIDVKEIKRIAAEKGLITQYRADNMNDLDAYSLIFEPGFSTASDVTDVSGRGVGMDVVRTNFQKIGGAIEISSSLGRGTTFMVRLPLTLTIMQSLIVSVENICFAIPQFNISEVVWLHGEDMYRELKSVNQQEVYTLRGRLIPILRLSKLLSIDKTYKNRETGEREPDRRQILSDRRKDDPINILEKERRSGSKGRRIDEGNSIYILVLKLGNSKYGLIIDSIVDTEEIVVKSLHTQMEKCSAFAGTTVLGDGRIALILDIRNLAEIGQLHELQLEQNDTGGRTLKEDKQAVLVFNIGHQEIYAIPLFLIKHIEKITADRIMVANNKEYLHFENNVIPLIRIENALNAVKSNYPENLYVIILKSKKPIGIIASEIMDNLMISSSFDSSTMDEPGIIGVVVINEKLTLILDIFKIIEKVEPEWFRHEIKENSKTRKILLLEDTEFYSSLLKSYLLAIGLDVVLAKNGREGIKAINRDKFDFIISDLEMPVMDGFEFARYVKGNEKYRNIPLLALSAAFDEDRGKKLAQEAGFDSYISKLNQEAMVDSLQRISKGRES